MEAQTFNGSGVTFRGLPMSQKGGIVSVTSLPINKIKLAKNSRTTINDTDLAMLMQSIKEVGLLQPIGVMQVGSDYEVTYGNRRFLAVSKLGYKHIPAVVHSNKKSTEADLMNLTENLQRRNISLTDAGRYMEMLKKEGLSMLEISTRLGISKSYAVSCLNAFAEVPKEFQDDLEVKTINKSKTRTSGKISINAANIIVKQKNNGRITAEEAKYLFKAAKNDDRFRTENVPRYVSAMKSKKKDPIGSVPRIVHVGTQFWIDEKVRDDLFEQYVTNGKYKSFSGLVVAILKGEENLALDITT